MNTGWTQASWLVQDHWSNVHISCRPPAFFHNSEPHYYLRNCVNYLSISLKTAPRELTLNPPLTLQIGHW